MRLRKSKSPVINFLFRKRVLIITVFFISVIIFAGISWQKFFIENSKWVPNDGGIFTDSVVGKVKNISPLAPEKSLLDLDLQQLLFSGLLRHNPLTGLIEDGLASLRLSEDGKTYFLTLKNSAKFSNGDPVSTDDIIFTYEEVIQNPGFSNDALKNAFEYVTLDIIDKSTVAFNLPEPNTYFSSLLATPILHKASYSKALIEEVNDPELPANIHPINTGPYVLKNIVHEEGGLTRIFLERNDYFFAGKPYIKKLVFYVYSNFNSLRENHIWTTMYSHLSSNQAREMEDNLFGEYSVREYLLPRFMGIFFNLDNTLPANPNLREALKLAIDKNAILSKESGWNRIDSVFSFEGIAGWQDVDFISSRKILRDKGFPYSKDDEIRIFNDSPVKLKMITSTAPSIYSRLAQNIARIWEKELDIIIDLEVLSPDDFQEALRARTYDLVFFGQNFSENTDTLSVWHSSQSGKLNLANLTHNDVDFLIEEVRFTGALSDLLTLEQKINEINPVISIATPQYDLLVAHNLLGFSKTFGKIRKHAERFSNIEKWHFEQQRDWDFPKHQSKFTEYFSWLFNEEKEPELDYREIIPAELVDENNNPSDEKTQ